MEQVSRGFKQAQMQPAFSCPQRHTTLGIAQPHERKQVVNRQSRSVWLEHDCPLLLTSINAFQLQGNASRVMENAHKSGISQHFQPQRQYLALSEATEPTGAAEEATESTLIAVDDEVGTHH